MDDYSSNGQVSPIFPPPQFLPKQQIQPNLPLYSTGLSSSINANSANPSIATNYHSSTTSNSATTAHLIHLPSDPSIYKEIQFNLISSDYSNNDPNNVNSQYSAYLIESVSLNSVIAGKFHQQSGGLIRFHLKQLPIWTRLAFLARRKEPPTLTNHELVEFITADSGSNSVHSSKIGSKRRSSRSVFEQIVFKNNILEEDNYELNLDDHINSNEKRIKRSSLNSLSSGGSTISIEYLEYFEPGQWFFVFINDASHEQQFNFHLNITKLTSARFPCPNDCNGHGLCEQGQCVCDNGFTESDCSRNICPVLCSGNGIYLRGACKCSPGYFGIECENKRSSTCSKSDLPCSGHGSCVAGRCVCNKNYFGDDCEQHQIESSETTCKLIKSNELNNYESKLIKETNQKQKGKLIII